MKEQNRQRKEPILVHISALYFHTWGIGMKPRGDSHYSKVVATLSGPVIPVALANPQALIVMLKSQRSPLLSPPLGVLSQSQSFNPVITEALGCAGRDELAPNRLERTGAHGV